MLNLGQILVVTFASLSILSAAIIIVTYVISAKWRNEYGRVKRCLVPISLCESILSMALMNISTTKATWACSVQASFVQFFGLGVLVFEAALSFEGSILAYSITLPFYPAQADKGWTLPSLPNYYTRIVLYYSFVLIYGVVAVAIMNFDDAVKIVENAEYLCYIDGHKNDIYLAGIPGTFFFSFIVLSNFYSIYAIISTFAPLLQDIDDSQHGPIGISIRVLDKLDKRTQRFLARLLLTPVLYACLAIPLIFNYENYSPENLWGMLSVVCFTASGLVNVIVWVVCDAEARKSLEKITFSKFVEVLVSCEWWYNTSNRTSQLDGVDIYNLDSSDVIAGGNDADVLDHQLRLASRQENEQFVHKSDKAQHPSRSGMLQPLVI